MDLYNSDWNEKLPECCPEEDGHRPQNEVYYRLVNNVPPLKEDFISQQGLQMTKIFDGITRCRALSISVFSDSNKMTKQKALPKFKNCKIVKIVLNGNDGIIQKTGKKSHYSWWMTKHYKIEQSEEV